MREIEIPLKIGPRNMMSRDPFIAAMLVGPSEIYVYLTEQWSQSRFGSFRHPFKVRPPIIYHIFCLEPHICTGFTRPPFNTWITFIF